MTLPRRRFLAALTIAGLAACRGRGPGRTVVASDPSPRPTPSPGALSSSRTPPATASPKPAPALPASPAYEPLAGEVAVPVKSAAASAALGLASYEPGQPLDALVAAVSGDDPTEATTLAASDLYTPHRWSRGEIVYPQLSGLTARRAGVMVVLRQRTGAAGSDQHDSEVRRVLDVRLRLGGDSWRVEEVASAGGDAIPEPAAPRSELAERVLTHPAIDLPNSPRWDILRGEIDDRLLTVMLRLAERVPYRVAVLKSGHPVHVFGTDRVSLHTLGRAVDVWAVGDRAVVEDRHEGSVTHRTVRWLYDELRLPKIGSPWALDGFGGRSFSDPVHQDHLHLSV